MLLYIRWAFTVYGSRWCNYFPYFCTIASRKRLFNDRWGSGEAVSLVYSSLNVRRNLLPVFDIQTSGEIRTPLNYEGDICESDSTATALFMKQHINYTGGRGGLVKIHRSLRWIKNKHFQPSLYGNCLARRMSESEHAGILNLINGDPH